MRKRRNAPVPSPIADAQTQSSLDAFWEAELTRETQMREADRRRERANSVSKELADCLGALARATVRLGFDDNAMPSASAYRNAGKQLRRFTSALRDASECFPRQRILERLKRATSCGVPALEAASSLLMAESSVTLTDLAENLKRMHASAAHREWPCWLVYIYFQLVGGPNSVQRDNVPLSTTRDEWRRADRALGSAWVDDQTFEVMQEAVEQGWGLVDDALAAGGYEVPNRPPGRVPDLIARYDHRALAWYCREPQPYRLLQPPESIERITEPEILNLTLVEIWTAANCLQMALEDWERWFEELRKTGDARPEIALKCNETAEYSIRVLTRHRPLSSPFDRAEESALLSMLPPLPAGWTAKSATEGDRSESSPKVPWQDDEGFWARYEQRPESRRMKSTELRSASIQLVRQLESYPLSVLNLDSHANQKCEYEGAGTTGAEECERPLTDREMDVLIAMFELKLFDSDCRRPAEQIVIRASGSQANANSIKQVIGRLILRGFVESVRGPGGGSWLTTSGKSRAEELRAKRL